MRVDVAVAVACLTFVPTWADGLQDANKAVVRGFFEEVLDQGHLDRYSQSHAANFVVHTPSGDAPLSMDMAYATEERKALPDMRVTVNRLLAEDDMVAVSWVARGTNTGDGMGFHATNAKVVVPGMTFFRLKEGKITEEWGVFDMAAAMRQAGLCPK